MIAFCGAQNGDPVGAQVPEVALRRRVLPHLHIHGRCDQQRAAARQAQGREQVVAEAVCEFGEKSVVAGATTITSRSRESSMWPQTREYSADETGARMVGQPYGLISALQKLGAYNQRIPTTSVSPSTSALCIVKPLFGGGGLSSLFSTHPPLEKRIQALREMTVTPQR